MRGTLTQIISKHRKSGNEIDWTAVVITMLSCRQMSTFVVDTIKKHYGHSSLSCPEIWAAAIDTKEEKVRDMVSEGVCFSTTTFNHLLAKYCHNASVIHAILQRSKQNAPAYPNAPASPQLLLWRGTMDSVIGNNKTSIEVVSMLLGYEPFESNFVYLLERACSIGRKDIVNLIFGKHCQDAAELPILEFLPILARHGYEDLVKSYFMNLKSESLSRRDKIRLLKPTLVEVIKNGHVGLMIFLLNVSTHHMNLGFHGFHDDEWIEFFEVAWRSVNFKAVLALFTLPAVAGAVTRDGAESRSFIAKAINIPGIDVVCNLLETECLDSSVLRLHKHYDLIVAFVSIFKKHAHSLLEEQSICRDVVKLIISYYY